MVLVEEAKVPYAPTEAEREEHEKTHTICAACSIALCTDCLSYLKKAQCQYNIALQTEQRYQETGIREPLPYCIPMALANDNMWGYTTSLTATFKVRWTEIRRFYLFLQINI